MNRQQRKRDIYSIINCDMGFENFNKKYAHVKRHNKKVKSSTFEKSSYRTIQKKTFPSDEMLWERCKEKIPSISYTSPPYERRHISYKICPIE